MQQLNAGSDPATIFGQEELVRRSNFSQTLLHCSLMDESVEPRVRAQTDSKDRRGDRSACGNFFLLSSHNNRPACGLRANINNGSAAETALFRTSNFDLDLLLKLVNIGAATT